jgi:phosphatidylglycerol:prolipoprotein diacylglycerol transferase
MWAVLAVIPYTTFPTIELGPLTLRTFGLFVALGVLVGAWLAARYTERFGISRDETYRVATWMVLAGIIGSRLTWAATHTDAIENPIDVIAIWEGGIQFSGGFIAALIVGLPFFKRWSRLQRWQVLDGFSFGLAIGLALGRLGCYSVGEHFGRTSDFFLATRYDGGEVREPELGDVPLLTGTSFHNTSLYELLYLLVLFAGMAVVIWQVHRRGLEVKPGTLVGVFLAYYGVARFLSDTLRVNDERLLHMTGAQWMSLVMVPAGAWILLRVRPRMAALAAAEAAAPVAATGDGDGAEGATADAAEGDGEQAKAEGDGAEPATTDATASDGDGDGEEAEAAEPESAPSDPLRDGDGAEPETDEPATDAAAEPESAPNAADGDEAEPEAANDDEAAGDEAAAEPERDPEPATAEPASGEGSGDAEVTSGAD